MAGKCRLQGVVRIVYVMWNLSFVRRLQKKRKRFYNFERAAASTVENPVPGLAPIASYNDISEHPKW